MHLFRVFGKWGMAETREQRTKSRKRGLKGRKGRERRAKVREKRGKIWGRVRWGNYPAWKWKKNGKSVKYPPFEKKEAFTPLKSTICWFYSILEKSILGSGRFFWGVLTPIFAPRSWTYEYPLICYFLNIVLVYLSAVPLSIDVTEGGNGVCRAGQRARQRAGQRAKISKNRRAARRKKSFFARFFWFFQKTFPRSKPMFSPVFACFTNHYARVRFHYLWKKRF